MISRDKRRRYVGVDLQQRTHELKSGGPFVRDVRLSWMVRTVVENSIQNQAENELHFVGDGVNRVTHRVGFFFGKAVLVHHSSRDGYPKKTRLKWNGVNSGR